MNVTECLLKITELTKENLNILTAINESFFAKNNAVQAVVSDTRYIIPSFLSLENKINHLQDAYDNLVHAAQSGEAWLNYDGNTRDIIIQQYNQAPNPLHLKEVSTFATESVDLFKDMTSPRPYINFTLNELPDNISDVLVKKIVLYDDGGKGSELLGKVQGLLSLSSGESYSDVKSQTIEYGAVAQILEDYTEDQDYTEYDTTYSLNPRKCLGFAEYTVLEVSGDMVRDRFGSDIDADDTVDLEEIITVTVDVGDNWAEIDGKTTPTYTGSDGYEKIALFDGCVLCSMDGSALFEVVSGLSDLQSQGETQFTWQLRVLNGSYVNIQPGSGDYGTLKFHSTSANNYLVNEDKCLHLPLEEDQYICTFITPLNSRVRVQGVWGSGLYINTYNLLKINSDGTSTSFDEYYDENVSNIGDTLNELTTIMSPSITKFSQEEYARLTDAKPNIDQNKTLDVVQINKHLDDSETVKTIRSLYAQKQQLNTELSEVEQRISTLNSELSQISFDDLSGTRSLYEAQLTNLKNQQNDLSSSISKVVDLISQSANNSTIPIENAKFRIRGFVDVESFIAGVNEDGEIIGLEDVIGVQIRYRYKNAESPQANVSSIGDFLFSEWTLQEPKVRKRKMSYSNGSYDLFWTDVTYDESGGEVLNPSENVPKFNQVDIPITQGESVDIQVRVLYSFGYPFVEVTSDWSDIENVEFPVELIQDVQVLSIIEENNSDIEKMRFENILENKGVNAHVDDKIIDQDLTYFHKPENIASGFYTDERRIIPLRDKLSDMNTSIIEIEDLIKGTTSDALEVSVNLDNQTYVIDPDVTNYIQLPAYSGVAVGVAASGTAFRNKSYGPVQLSGSIKITNITQHTVYLYSVFPAARTTNVPDIRVSRRKFDLGDYYNFDIDRIVDVK